MKNVLEDEPYPNSFPMYRCGIGQDSHRFLPEGATKPCIIGGLIFEDVSGLDADSDGDVIYHAICNAITSLTGVPVLGGIAKELCNKDGITDSQIYLETALNTLVHQKIVHLAITLEGKTPYFQNKIDELRKNISSILKVRVDQVGITATSGDGLTDFGCGRGIQCFCILSTVQY